MSLIKTISLKPLGDERGSLIALEGNKNVPFNIKRVYYIFNTQQGVARGFHAHRNLKQLAVCVTGSCRFILDNGKQRETIRLDNATKGLLLEDLIWREMHDFTPDCVLMILASEYYDETDYIRDYATFYELVNG
ncbi:sugar 3,4-ketoisomerase [Thiomicrospira microaerophila]|uniref:sugar 3,4-ketoisomerase n=1 Tax=Thiomicrospira microaerophila TaxID=406020 RepID=UPI0005C9745A|nr:FdtA/QdtA family cupin domain-containing protein [Thiomicrospira microaerophila]